MVPISLNFKLILKLVEIKKIKYFTILQDNATTTENPELFEYELDLRGPTFEIKSKKKLLFLILILISLPVIDKFFKVHTEAL